MTETTEDAAPVDESGEIPQSEREDVLQQEDTPDDEPDTFPRAYVEDLRQENGKYRLKAQRSDQLAERLHTELVRATGRLADPTDIAFDESHIDDPETLTAAIDELLSRKPHLASRKPIGNIGQGNQGPSAESFSLLGLLKEHT